MKSTIERRDLKTHVKLALTILSLIVAIATTAYAQQYPKPTGYVNDFANVLTHEQGVRLNDELAAFEQKTTVEIAIVTVHHLNNQSIEDYARELAKEWGVGKRGQNNGVVFLIAPKEHKMRIATASGARTILSDTRADQIRDNVVLHCFRANNMAQGIIDGAHEIMRTLDEKTTPASIENETLQAPTKERGFETTKVLGCVLISFGGVVLLLFLIILPIRRRKTRKHVLKAKDGVATRFVEAERIARSSDVKEKTRKKLVGLKSVFSSIEKKINVGIDVKWLELRKKLNSIDYQLGQIMSDMEHEISFADKARNEGPELLRKIPGMIEDAKKKLNEGKLHPKARKCIENAQRLYGQVQAIQQNQPSGMSIVNWVVLYALLHDSHLFVSEAATSTVTNSSHVPSRHSSDSLSAAEQRSDVDHFDNNSPQSGSSDSNPSYGFGNSDGFSGGGGFDSGDGSSGSDYGSGGGSSGSW